MRFVATGFNRMALFGCKTALKLPIRSWRGPRVTGASCSAGLPINRMGVARLHPFSGSRARASQSSAKVLGRNAGSAIPGREN
jgi:hypothetical protein